MEKIQPRLELGCSRRAGETWWGLGVPGGLPQEPSATHLSTAIGQRRFVGRRRGNRTSVLHLQAECGRARA